MFLCREKELQKLSERYQSHEMECIIIYGRRRVGKTALINEFCKNKPAIYFPALNSNSSDNLTALSQAIHSYYHPDTITAPVYASYDDALREITKIAKRKRTILVIDEFPFLAKSEPSISSRLQHLLDNEWKDSKLFLILCGSSMSYMEKEVLSEKSPLFGRRTAQIKLQPMNYLDTAKFHPELSPEDNALIYGITGGIPHYINKLNVNGSIKEALIRNYFEPSAYLFEEPGNLLKQELREPALYNSIITSIANGASKISEIAEKSKIEPAVCSKYLKILEELEIVKKIEPVVDKNAKKKIYRITDNFFRFWYRFIPKNMMVISSGNIERMFDMVIQSYIPEYMGLVFEEICRQYLISHMENLPFFLSELGEWWGTDPVKKKEAQLDIVGTGISAGNSSEGMNYIIGSCKYRNEIIGTDELALIENYASLFTHNRDKCFYYLFSKSGFTKGLKEKQASGEAALFTLEDIYK